LRFLIQFIVAGLFIPAIATAEPYVSAFGGISIPTDRFANDVTDFDRTNGTDGFIFPEVIGFDANGVAITTSQPDFSTGPVFGGAIGYEFKLSPKTFLRIEAEGSHQRLRDNVVGPELFAEEFDIADALFLRAGANSTLADLNSTNGMLNIKFGHRFFSDKLSPYVGVGIGVTRVNYKIHQTSFIDFNPMIRLPLSQKSTGQKTNISWQSIVGLSTRITPKFELFAEGRYFQTSTFEVNAPTRKVEEFIVRAPNPPIFSPPSSNSIVPAPGFPATAHFSNTNILIGLRISLN